MVVNDNAGWQVPRGVLGFIASKLAPTKGASAPALKTQNPMIDHGVLCFIHSKCGICCAGYSGAGWMISTQ
ncbi:hypothetical protein AN403_1144 [Pseudomonas fluorescens]|uniref:Uncharacterized protein n=1 Tax=Pseudomonas fluorescens TaxID=294 RepID=A0A0P8WLK7_PSEFL|nr:hypothetical protein AN403_1144 [Pseudomonas fluorescens]